MGLEGCLEPHHPLLNEERLGLAWCGFGRGCRLCLLLSWLFSVAKAAEDPLQGLGQACVPARWPLGLLDGWHESYKYTE